MGIWIIFLKIKKFFLITENRFNIFAYKINILL